MSTKKNLINNGAASAFQKIVKVLEQLVLVPFFISAWGAAYYGEWLTFTIIPSVLSFSDLGFGSAAANAFVLKYVAGDKKGAADIEKTGFIIILAMVVIGTFASALLMIILNHLHVFEKALIKPNDAIWSVSILIFARLIQFFIQLYEAHFRAARRAALSINLISLNSLLSIIAGIIVLLMGKGIVAFSVSQLIVSIAFLTFFAFEARRVLALHKETKGRINKKDFRMITNKGFGYLMAPIWQSIYFDGTTFAVRLTLGAESVAIYNTVRTLSRSVNQLYSMVNATVFPELQFELGSGNVKRAHKLFRLSVIGVFIIAVIGAIFLSLFGSWFYKIWTHNKLIVPPGMWNIFIFGIIFNALWWTAGTVFRAVNKPYQLALAGLLSSIVSVMCSYFLSKWLGLNGAALGTVVLEVLMAIYILPTSCNLIGMRLKDLFKSIKDDFSILYKVFPFKIRSS